MPAEKTSKTSRRTFLRRVSSITAAAGALALTAGACDEKPQDAPSPDAKPASCEPTPADKQADIALITDAVLREEEALKLYAAAAGLPFIASDPVVLATAARFMGHHQDHSGRLKALLKALGGPDADLSKVTIRPLPPDITDATKDEATRKTATLRFARDVEMSAAKAYFKLVTTDLRTPQARQVIADIMPAEAQHVAIYDMVLGVERPSSHGFLSEQA